MSLQPECRLFGTFRNALRADLCQLGCPIPVAGAILNWFNPENSEYLQHVDAWQQFLCLGVTREPAPWMEAWSALGRKGAYGFSFFEADPIALAYVHQVAKILYKYHGEARRKTDFQAVKSRLRQPRPIHLSHWELEAMRRALSALEPPHPDDVIGRFGPGSTADGFTPYDRWRRIGNIPDISPSFYRCSCRDTWCPSGYDFTGVTRITEVPKSIKCNRIVSSEPAMRMYAQLGLADYIDPRLHSLFYGHVSLHDQIAHRNRLYAENSVTIDLSDASDYVSKDLVASVLPQLWPFLAKVRSNFALFPDGEEVPLGTFAPMGSGLCFVVMTAVLLALLSVGCGSQQQWSTYGDDIIIPREADPYVRYLLNAAGLVVNNNKSCSTGWYKEACGLELFKGFDLTPFYVRDDPAVVPSSTIEDGLNRLDSIGMSATADALFEMHGLTMRQRWNVNLQRWELSVKTDISRYPFRCLDGYDGLNRWFSLHTQQERDRADHPVKCAARVRTRLAYRFRATRDYPNLAHRLTT